ncbi:MAG: ion transporter [Bacteroidales bacterium]|nr:ion transporter [Bacteroidales bacterium]
MISKRHVFEVIFGTSTKEGKRFDELLLYIILASVAVVVLNSVPILREKLGTLFIVLEWIFTIVFTVEYFIRIYVVPHRWRYVFSFWGVIDVISFLPTYLSLFIPGYNYLIILRIIRLLRVFQIFALPNFLRESKALYSALRSSIYKISIFLLLILIIVIVLGTIMYIVEGEESGFSSIPQGVYWAIITITTVGYGDIVPTTVLGKFISSFIMLIGYSIIAVPTGIITFELSKKKEHAHRFYCKSCHHQNPTDSTFCNQCGMLLTDHSTEETNNNGK